MVRIRREAGSNCKILDYLPRDAANSDALRAFRENDLALEQTYNKQGKTTFLKGVTQNNAAREKCTKTAPFLTSVSGCVKDMASVGPEMSCHHEESERQTREDLALVEAMKENINEKFVNPFR